MNKSYSNKKAVVKAKKSEVQHIKLAKLEKEINSMTSARVVNALKQNGLPVYGTLHEKRDRLRTYYGISGKSQWNTSKKLEPPTSSKKDSTRVAIEEINKNREKRRKRMEEKKKIKKQKQVTNQQQGIKWDVDFQIMVEAERAKVQKPQPHNIPDMSKINICIRKRPLFLKEAEDGEIDCVSCTNPGVIVHKWKFKVDGVTKYIDNGGFEFDNTFSETESSDSLYYSSIQPQIDFLFDGGVVTWFAYGQTGSGKTFTMEGVQKLAVNDFFAGAEIMKEETGRLFTFTVSYYEIYNGKVFDLLDRHKQKKVQEDMQGQIKIPGLKEVQARSGDEMNQLIEYGLSVRKTKSTAWNDTSSRSHAIGTINIKEINNKNQVIADSGKLLLVDLAGSENAQDSQSNVKERRIEGAEINTSLLALKEWIRSMDSGKSHVPFRQSKLTMVLRDSFMGDKNKTHIIMIACISPTKTWSEHSLNTLRYAERLKVNIDEIEAVDKYMSDKVVSNISHFTEVKDTNEFSDEVEDIPSEEGISYQHPEIYRSHDFSPHKNQLSLSPVKNEPEEILKDLKEEYKHTNYNEIRKPSQYEFENPEFSDSSNLIELNNGVTTTYDIDVQKIDYHNTSDFKKLNKRPSYSHLATNYNSQPKYTRKYDKEYLSNKNIASNDNDEDQLMQVDSDGSDTHHSPHLYISANKEASFSKGINYRNNLNSTFHHSSSNHKLQYVQGSRGNTQDNMQANNNNSTTSFRVPEYEKRSKPQSIEINLKTDRSYNLHRTSLDLSKKKIYHKNTPYLGHANHRMNHPAVTTHENSLSNRYKNVVTTKSGRKNMVAGYASYLRNEGANLNPSSALLANKLIRN